MHTGRIGITQPAVNIATRIFNLLYRRLAVGRRYDCNQRVRFSSRAFSLSPQRGEMSPHAGSRIEPLNPTGSVGRRCPHRAANRKDAWEWATSHPGAMRTSLPYQVHGEGRGEGWERSGTLVN